MGKGGNPRPGKSPPEALSKKEWEVGYLHTILPVVGFFSKPTSLFLSLFLPHTTIHNTLDMLPHLLYFLLISSPAPRLLT